MGRMALRPEPSVEIPDHSSFCRLDTMEFGAEWQLLQPWRSIPGCGSRCPAFAKERVHTRRGTAFEEYVVDIHQTANLERNAEYSALVAQTDQSVRATVDVATADATWDLAPHERGRPLLVLRLQDQLNGQCSAAFAPDELRSEQNMGSRLHSLKGALVRVGHWREQLRLLFGNIRQWCEALPGGAYVQEEPILMREERSGEYEAARLLITSNGQLMRVEPVASWIVGADGRVDLRGIGGPFTLLYSQQGGGWLYLRETLPMEMYPLTQELFLQLAVACLNG